MSYISSAASGIKAVATHPRFVPFIKGAAPDVISSGIGRVAGEAAGEMASGIASGLIDAMSVDSGDDDLANPRFAENGHEGESPSTTNYFRTQKTLKMLASGSLALYGQSYIASGAQVMNAGVAWYRINALFNQMVPASRRGKKPEYANWYSWTVAKKAVPPGSLEMQMTRIIRQKMYSGAGGAPKLGVAFGLNPVVGYFVSSAADAWQGELDSFFGQDTVTLAQGLHWFAFLETVVSGGRGTGPAQRILEVLWKELGFGSASGVTPKDIIREPRGWLVVADYIK